MIQDKAQQWVNDVRNSKLHHRNVWFLLKFQLCPQIVYGLCSSTATFNKLSNALPQQYYQILPLGGVVRTSTTESRMIVSGFYGIGLPHLGVEALAAMLNKLLMHYGCDMATGWFMRASHSLFLLELGILLQPLQESYTKYSFLSTHSWMKMLWEKASLFDVRTVVTDAGMVFLQEGNQFIMQVFFEKGYPWETLLRLNRVRVYWQVLFLSDIFTPSGNKIDTEIIVQPQVRRKQSQMRWPTEHPTKLDFQLWRNAMTALCPSQDTRTRLGLFIAPTHRIWDWRWNKSLGCLCRSSKNRKTEDVFRAERKPNRFYYSETRPSTKKGIICSVKPTHAGQVGGGWRLTSLVHEATPALAPQTFMDTLYSWGNMWLWDNVSVAGGYDWLHEAIQDGSLLAVTDGLYIRELYPNLCLAAFVAKCKKG